MLDIHMVRGHPELVAAGLTKRGQSVALDAFRALDERRRALVTKSRASSGTATQARRRSVRSSRAEATPRRCATK